MSDDKIKDEKKGAEESQYEKFAQKTAEFWNTLKEKTPEALDRVMEKAKKELVEAGELGAKKAEEFSEYLKKDLAVSKEEFGKLSEIIKDKSHPSRLSAGMLNIIHDIAQVLGEQLQGVASKTEEKLLYKTGGICGPCTLTCTKCGKQVHLTKTSRIPPCSGCKGASTFKKSY